MRKKVLAMFIILLMIMQMIPVYAEVLVGGYDEGSATTIYSSISQIQLDSDFKYFKFTPTDSATYTISIDNLGFSDVYLLGSNGSDILAYGELVNGNQVQLIADLTANHLCYLGLSNYIETRVHNLTITGGGLFSPIDITPPNPPVIQYMTEDRGTSNSDRITSDNTITINGTSEPISTIYIYQNGDKIGETGANDSGIWAFDYRETELPDGDYTFTAKAIDASNNISQHSIPFVVKIDTNDPETPSITSFSDDLGRFDSDRITKDNTLILNGTAEPNSIIHVMKDSVSIGTTTADASGNWSFDYSGTSLSDGAYSFTATSSDIAGNTSPASSSFTVTIDTLRPDSPIITSFSENTGISSSDLITKDNGLSIYGTAEQNSIINVMKDSVSIGTTTADAIGNWSFDYSGTSLSDGAYTFTATSSDTAGNVSMPSSELVVTVDTTKPAAPAITSFSEDTGNSNNDRITNDRTPTIYGVSEPNSVVNVYFNDSPAGAAVTSDASGNWVFEYTGVPLSAGAYYCTAKATDAAGNVSTLSAQYLIQIISTTPTITNLDPLNKVTGVYRDSNLAITFSENIYAGSGSVKIYRKSDNVLIESISVTDPRVIGFGNNVININPENNLDYKTTYYVQIDETAFTDIAGNRFSGISNSSDWYFTTEILEHVVKFYGYNGELLKQETVEDGENATAPATPSREGYTFSGWDKSFNTITEALTITAQWDINEYTITFNSNGGSVIPAITQDFGTTISAPADPTRTGYTFAGWNIPVPTTMPAGNITLTAQWDINEYTITFNSNGGSAISTMTQNYGTAIIIPTNPTKTGYTFSGWDSPVPTTMPASNMTLTAQWDINQYTITFNSNGGSAVPAITQNYGTTISAPADPTRTGYTFTGWDKTIPTAMPATNITITADWEANEYSITFNSDGGSTIPAITQEYGTAITVPANPTKTGYIFTGWDSTVPVTMPASNMTLIAQWDINRYTITFNSNGGSAVSSMTQNYGTSIIAPADPTRTGYIFTGWDKMIPTTMPASNMTLIAQWDINRYTITFNSNGGSAVSSMTQNYGTSIIAPADPTRTGYIFTGWDKMIPTTMPASNITITANWEIKPYQRVINAIANLPNPADVSLSDVELIKSTGKLYSELSVAEKSMIPEDYVRKLNLVATAYAELILRDNSTGIFVKAKDGTMLNPSLVLLVDNVDETLEQKESVQQSLTNVQLLRVFDIKLMLGTETVQPSGIIRVSIPIPTELLEGYTNHQIVFISDNGEVTIIPSTVEGNMIWFETDHFSNYGIVAKATGQENVTVDVPKTGEHNSPFYIFAIMMCLILSAMLVLIRRKFTTNE